MEEAKGRSVQQLNYCLQAPGAITRVNCSATTQISGGAPETTARVGNGREGGRLIISPPCVAVQEREVCRGLDLKGHGLRAKSRVEASKVRGRKVADGLRLLTSPAVAPAPVIRRLRPLQESGRDSQRPTKRLAATAISREGESGEAV